jgi:nitrate/TMAO reductase-like tetraheme cytochrome c subunit
VPLPNWVLILFIAAAGVLALFVGLRIQLTRSREGKVLAFIALFLLPAAAAGIGFSAHMQRAESKEFCLSCHVMHDYGQSLLIDDPSYIPAQHYQNNLVPRNAACYTCHTDYTMFGPVEAKIRGVRHLWVQYLGTVPRPQDIKLYSPYNNRECLHCHLGARRFEQASPHHKTPELLADIKANRKSCVSGGCHEFIHDVGSLKDMTFWKETPQQ